VPTQNKFLRYGIIGTGMMGCEHIRNLQAIADCEVVAYADPHDSSRAQAAELLPDASAFTDYQQMLANEKLDVVVIATPNHTHRKVLEDVLMSGVHVLVEKPLCISTQECREAIALEEKTRTPMRVVWVGLEYRYMAPTARILDECSNGSAGSIKMISIREHRFPFLKKIGDWNRFSKNTGGTLVEKCCHFFDVMILLANSKPISVFASGGQDVNHLSESYDGSIPDILDNAYVIVEFANGIRGALDLSMFAEGSLNEQEICVVGDEAKIEALITESKIRIGKRNLGSSGVVEISVRHDESVVPGFHAGASYVEHLAMQNAIRRNLPTGVSLEHALLSVAVGQAAHLSIAERRRVDLAEIL